MSADRDALVSDLRQFVQAGIDAREIVGSRVPGYEAAIKHHKGMLEKLDRLAALPDSKAASVAPEGWKLAPVEPTPSMLKAAADTPGMQAVNNMLGFTQARGGFVAGFPGEGSPLEQAWRAMLAAAPEHAPGEGS